MSQSPLSDMNYITSLSGWCLVLGCLFLFTFVICPSGELGMVITLLYIFTGLSSFFFAEHNTSHCLWFRVYM